MSYENIEADFHYENSGASHEEMPTRRKLRLDL